MKKFLKAMIGCFMIAALVMPTVGAAKAEENTPGQEGTTSKPVITDLFLEASSTEISIDAINFMTVSNSKDPFNSDGLEAFYNFEWKISDNLDFITNDNGMRKTRVVGTKLGDATVSVTITDKEDAKSTVTLSAKFKVAKGPSWITNTKDPITTDKIIEEMKNSDYLAMHINPEVTTEVSKDVFAAAKENGTDLSFFSDKGNGNMLTFSFAASELINTNINFNPNFTIDAENEAVKAIVPANVKPLIIDFEHNGNLPGKALITVMLNEEQMKSYEGYDKLYLYHVDTASGKLVLTGMAEIIESSIAFEITHCSQYVLTTEKLTDAQTVLQELDDAPNTGV